jgi:hypothetical protein
MTTHPHAAEIVEAIRSHKTIGRYTCSVIDECYSDEELIKEFGWTPAGKPRTVLGAVRDAIYAHNCWADRFNEIASTAW